MSETPKVIIPGNLKGSVPENIVTDALYILDSSRAKNQKVINDEFEQRIDDIQELAEISIEGGTIQIATAADFNNPTQEQRAKVPTVGAVIDGYTANILPNTGNPSTPIYIDNFHRPQVVTSILLPGNISSQNGNIEALNGGVAAYGIATLSINESGGGGGTITQIRIDGTIIPDVNGIVNLPAYPAALSDLTDDEYHRVVTDSQVTLWTSKYEKPSGGIPLTDLTSSVRSSLGKADTALQQESDPVFTASPAYGISSSDISSWSSAATRLGSLIAGLTSKGAHNLPIYLNANAQAEEIDSLRVSGDIESTGGGVSAMGIATLAISGGSEGTVTGISVNTSLYTPSNGIVTLPNYPTAASLISDGLASQSWVLSNFASITYESRVQAIEALIPSQATSSNKLADRAFVNSSISTATATFRGTNTTATTESAFLTWANALTHDLNDYVFWKTEDSVGNVVYKRYKYDGTQWVFEYDLNNSSFTADQWSAINSGITSSLVTAFNAKYDKPSGGIPKTDLASSVQTSLGLADTALQSHQTIYSLIIKKNGTQVGNTYNPATAAQTIDITDVASASALSTLTTGLTSKGAHDLPIYLNSSAQAVAIDSLSVPGNIQSTNGGVSAGGIATLALNGEGGGGTLTQIQIDGTVIPDVNGVVNLPAYPVIPTAVSAFTNDAGYITSYVNTAQLKVSSTSNKRISTIESGGKYIQFSGGTNKFTVSDGTDSFDVAITPNVTFPVTSVVGQTGAVTTLQVATALTNAGYKLTDTTYTFTDSDASVNWNTRTKIATVGGTDIHITIPARPTYAFSDLTSHPDSLASYGISDGVNGSRMEGNGNAITSVDFDTSNPHTLVFTKGSTFKTQQTAKSSPSASGNSLSFIDTISQDTNGVITATKKTIYNASATQSGIVTTTDQTFGGDKTFNGDIHGMKGVSALGIATLTMSGGGSGTVTQLTLCGISYLPNNGVITVSKSELQTSLELGAAAYVDIGAVASGETRLVTGDSVNSAINAALTAAMKVEGVTTTPISNGSTTTPVTINGQSVSAYKGMVVFYSSKEFVWAGTNWVELGDESSFALKTTSVSGTGYLSGGGSLSENRTIDISTTAKGYIDTAYSHATDANRLTTAQTSGFYKFATTAEGHIKSVTAVTASDLTTLIGSTTYAPYNSAGYLPLSGGTMANTNLVSNLNADLLDGKHSSDFVSALGTSGDYLTWTKTGGSANNITIPYASLATDTRVENLTNQSITYRQTGGGTLTKPYSSGVIKRIEGNTVVWNQAVNSQGSASGGAGAGSAVKNADGSFTYTKTTTGTTYPYFWIGVGTPVVIGHTYLLYFKTKGAMPNGFGMYEGYTGQYVAMNKSKILTATTYTHNGLVDLRQCENGAVVTIFYSIIDLTLFFNGNIPTGLTAETFERDYGYLLANPEYNAGTIINNACSGLESGGFNLWDEEWENAQFNTTTGVKNVSTTKVASKNYIPVVGGFTYHATKPANYPMYVFKFDRNKNYLGFWSFANDVTFEDNVAFIQFQCGDDSHPYATYAHDICINLSDSSRNGTYEPYRKTTLPLNLNSFRVKDAQGNISTINGLKKAGAVYDEIVGRRDIGRIGEVDLGTLSWTRLEYSGTYVFRAPLAHAATDNGVNARYPMYSGTAAANMPDKTVMYRANASYLYIRDDSYTSESAFTTAMNGVYCNYALATPIEYEIIDDLPTTYAIDTLGTEAIPEGEQVAPFIADIQYGARQTDISYDIDNLFVISVLLRGRATTLEGYFTDGIANNATRLSNTSDIGSTTKPVYFTEDGVPAACSTYAGGTAITLNGSSKAASTASFYAPTVAGTAGQILKSTAGTPEWINQSAITAGALTTVSKTLFGNTYWTSGGVPTSIGTSSSPAALNYVTNIDSILYFDRTNNRVGIGTSSPSERLAVDGNAIVYGKVTASNDITSVRNVVGLGGVAAYGIATLDMSGGTLGVTQVNVGSTAYTPTNGIVSLPAYPTWSTLSGKPSLAAVATSGDYDDLSNKPTKLSDFTNDASYLTNMAFESKSGTGSVTGKDNTFTFCSSASFHTFTATLPTIDDTTKCHVVMFRVQWASGYNAYNITSSHVVSFMHDFSIVAGGTYFIKAIFAGRWYVSAERVE